MRVADQAIGTSCHQNRYPRQNQETTISRYRSTFRIEASVERLCELMSDSDRLPEWNRGFDRVENATSPLRGGDDPAHIHPMVRLGNASRSEPNRQ